MVQCECVWLPVVFVVTEPVQVEHVLVAEEAVVAEPVVVDNIHVRSGPYQR